jgi:hypothetical protein
MNLPRQSPPVMRNVTTASLLKTGVEASGIACTLCHMGCDHLSGMAKTLCNLACDHTVCS